MSNSYDIPNAPMLDAANNVNTAWLQFFQRTHVNARTLGQSGPTAQRPNDLLWIGRPFFDTTLGKPIWIKTVTAGVAAWVTADGAAA